MLIGSCIVALVLASEPPRYPGDDDSTDDGIGLLATGGLLATVGATLAAVPLLRGMSCGPATCSNPRSLALTSNIVGPAAFVLSSPFLAVGMHRARMARIRRELADDPRRVVKRPRPFALAAGIVTMAAGGALLGAAVVLVRSPFAEAARWIGGPTLVGGALLTGAATAQRRARPSAAIVVPVVSRTGAGVSITRAF